MRHPLAPTPFGLSRHSYERHSIERWLAAHATSPLTGRALPHKELVPNHRLRAVIEDLHQDEAVL